MAKKATKRENGEGYVEKMKSGNYACTIYSKYIDPNTLKYKKIKRTMPTEKEAIGNWICTEKYDGTNRRFDYCETG